MVGVNAQLERGGKKATWSGGGIYRIGVV
jgi:hypothetical protein